MPTRSLVSNDLVIPDFQVGDPEFLFVQFVRFVVKGLAQPRVPFLSALICVFCGQLSRFPSARGSQDNHFFRYLPRRALAMDLTRVCRIPDNHPFVMVLRIHSFTARVYGAKPPSTRYFLLSTFCRRPCPTLGK